MFPVKFAPQRIQSLHSVSSLIRVTELVAVLWRIKMMLWNFTPSYNKTQPQLDIIACESLDDQ